MKNDGTAILVKPNDIKTPIEYRKPSPQMLEAEVCMSSNGRWIIITKILNSILK